MNRPIFFVLAFGFSFLCSCGVKGPPLPPIATTPQESDRILYRPAASPTPLSEEFKEGLEEGVEEEAKESH